MRLWNMLAVHRQQTGLFPGFSPVDLVAGPRSPSVVNLATNEFVTLWNDHKVGYAPHDSYILIGQVAIDDLSAASVNKLSVWLNGFFSAAIDHLLEWQPCYPTKVDGLVVTPSNMANFLVWKPATDKIPIAAYEVQKRENWSIISLDGAFTYGDAETLRSVLVTRWGMASVDAGGKATIDEGGFTSFSRADFTDVTFVNIEIGATYTSGNPALIVRSNNGAGPYGWSAYVLVAGAWGIVLHKSTLGSLGPALAFHAGPMAGKRISLRAEGAVISGLVDGVVVCQIYDTSYANGVVGVSAGSGGGVWAFGPTEFRRVLLSADTDYADVNLLNGLEIQYRVRAIDAMGWSGPWSVTTSGTPFIESLDVALSLAETVTAALQGLAIAVTTIEQTAVAHSETVTAALQGLAIAVTTIEQTAVAHSETVTAALQSLSLVVSTIEQTAAPHSETVTAALQTLDVHVHEVTRTPVDPSETVTAVLGSLTITVTNI